MLKFWFNTFAMILLGTLLGGVMLYGISAFAGLYVTYRMACGMSFIGTYFSTINRKPDADVDILESFVNYILACGIISVSVLLMHFGFKIFGA